MSQNLMTGNWQKGLRYLVPLLAFAGGVLVAERIAERFRYAKKLHSRCVSPGWSRRGVSSQPVPTPCAPPSHCLPGHSPNLVINEALIEGGYEGLSFFSFLPVGLIVIAIGVVYLLPLSKTLVRKQRAKRDTEADKSLNDLVY